MKRRITIHSAAMTLRFLVFGALLAVGSGCNGPDAPVHDYELTDDMLPIVPVKFAVDTPRMIGYIDAAWSAVKPVHLTATAPDGSEVQLEVFALHSQKHLFLAVRWTDHTESLNRLWVYKHDVWQTGLLLDPRNGEWAGGTACEDGLAVFLPNRDAAPDFRKNAKSTITVSKYASDGDALTYTGPGNIDVWRWMAQRTNPVDQASDEILFAGVDGPIHDQGTGGSRLNGSLYPTYADLNNLQSDKRILLNSKAALLDVDIHKGIGVPDDIYIPRDIISKYSGSRGDISAMGQWTRQKKSAHWVVMFKRPLDTLHADDTSLSDTLLDYPAMIGVMDNSNFDRMRSTGPFVFKFEN